MHGIKIPSLRFQGKTAKVLVYKFSPECEIPKSRRLHKHEDYEIGAAQTAFRIFKFFIFIKYS
jgi:hypothetical protein